MATFYVLPPRECLEQALSQFCGQVLPGMPVPVDLCEQFLTHWANGLSEMSESLCLHREDLPATGDMQTDLVEAFGAEVGDQVVEIAWSGGSAPAPVRTWTIDLAVSETESMR
jgi:hypothetical protein